MRKNNMPYGEYVEILRDSEITPMQQLQDIKEVCKRNRELSREIYREFYKRKKCPDGRLKWRLNLQRPVSKLISYPQALEWMNLQHCLIDLVDEIFGIMEGVESTFHLNLKGDEHRYSKESNAPIYHFLNDDQVEYLEDIIFDRWASIPVEPYHPSLSELVAEEGQPMSSKDDMEPVRYTSLQELSEPALDVFYDEVTHVGILCNADIGAELADASWCYNELRHFLTRMDDGKLPNLAKAFYSSET